MQAYARRTLNKNLISPSLRSKTFLNILNVLATEHGGVSVSTVSGLEGKRTADRGCVIKRKIFKIKC